MFLIGNSALGVEASAGHSLPGGESLHTNGDTQVSPPASFMIPLDRAGTGTAAE